MERVKKIFNWCLEKGKRGKEHKGLLKIKPDAEEAEKQMKKALSDIDTMQYLYEGGKTDWVASAAFYAMYHSLLSILYQLGYESRNQECTITAIEFFIENKRLSVDKALIDMIRSVQKEGGADAKTTREEMQYSAKLSLEDARCKTIMQNAVLFVEKMRAVLKEL